MNWSVLPGTVTASITNSAGCVITISKNIASSCEEPECQNDLTLNTVDGSTAIHKVLGTILTQGNYSVPAGVTIKMLAGQSIRLTPNSKINSGAVFTAKIGDCYTYLGRGTNSDDEASIGEIRNYDDIMPVYERSSIRIFPNPSDNLITITSSVYLVNITIISLDGKMIFNKSLQKVTSETIDIQKLSKGICIVISETADGQKQNSKIIKN